MSKHKKKKAAPRKNPFRLSWLPDFRLEDRTTPTDFSNVTPITINDSGAASPSPSTVTVSGLTGQQITNLQVLFNGLSHTSPEQIDAMLIAPTGQHIYLMSDAGGDSTTPVSGVNLTFADSGIALTTGQITAATYKPTNINQGDPDTITGGPTSPPVTTMAAFQGLDPNGTWELRIDDDTASFDTGSISGGWTLRVEARSNTPPVAVNDSYTVNEDTTLTTSTGAPPFSVLNNDTDGESDPLTVQLVSTTKFGTLALNANGSFTYIPRANFNGTDSFTYRATDGVAVSNVATATITVTAVNDVPVANDDTLTVQNGGPQTIHRAVLLANDIDPDLTYRTTIFSEGFENLPLQKWNTGTTTNTDETNWTDALPAGWTRDNTTTPAPSSATAAGAEFYGWHVMDVDSWVAQQGDQQRTDFTRGGVGFHGTVIVGDGDAYDDFVSLGTTRMNTLLTTPNISLAGINANTLTLEFDSSFRPEDPDPGNQLGKVEVSLDGGAWTNIQDLTFANSGGVAGSRNRTNEHLALEINNPFGAATAKFKFSYLDAGNDWWWAIDNIKVTGDRTDPAQETIQIQSQPAHGSVSVDANGAVIYTPSPLNYTGPDSFTYRLFDGVATSNTATVNLTVNGNAAAPVAVNDNYSTLQGVAVKTQFDRSVLLNDTDADLTGGNGGVKALLVSAPVAAQGTVAFNQDGTFLFTPNAAFFGNATFTYKLNDGTTDSNTATVTIAVVQNNFAAPVGVNDTYSVNNNGTLTVIAAAGVLANDTDADGNPLTAFATKGPNGFVIGPDHGTLTFNADGSFVYVPRPYFNGTDKFTYQAFDGAFNSNLATVTITVNAVNVAPQANNDTYFMTAGTPLTVTAPGVLANDRDDGPNVQLFLETFESLTLNPWNSGTTTKGDGTDWTDALPTGWVRDNTNSPTPSSSTAAGAEFYGWNVMDADSWSAQQGSQGRSDFTRGGSGLHGNVVVADGDAYTDFVSFGSSRMNTLLTTPSIPLGAITPNSLQLEFDSSFRPEDPPPANQHGLIQVSYDDGANWISLLDLTPANSGGAGSRIRTNEHLTLDANNPAGATTAKFRFGYLEAGNDWWWAIDNVKAVGSTANAGAALAAQIVNTPPAAEGTVALNANGSFTFTPASGFTGATSFTYQTTDGTNTSAPATVNIVPAPIVVAPVQINAGNAQRSRVTSLTVPFNVVVTLQPGAFTLTRISLPGGTADNTVITSAAGGQISVSTAVVSGKTVATLTFTGTGGVDFTSLADGVWKLTVDRTKVSGANGGPAMAADFVTPTDVGNTTTRIYRLFGDFNHDGAVDGLDKPAFDATLNLGLGDTGYLAAADRNNDDAVDGLDKPAFDFNLNVTIDP